MAISRRHHLVPLAAWTGAWLVTMALAIFGSEFLWDYAAVPTLLAVVGIVGGLGYSVLDITNLIPFDAEIGHTMALFALAYLVALCAGMRRRR